MGPKTIRRRALECMQLADKAFDPRHRELLLDMAHCWANLANASDRFLLFADAAETRLIDRVDLRDALRGTRSPRTRGANAKHSGQLSYSHRPRGQASDCSLVGAGRRGTVKRFQDCTV